jgi:hypothetical protein
VPGQEFGIDAAIFGRHQESGQAGQHAGVFILARSVYLRDVSRPATWLSARDSWIMKILARAVNLGRTDSRCGLAVRPGLRRRCGGEPQRRRPQEMCW